MKKLGKMLFEALSSLFKKPATSEYPKKRRLVHDSFAGMISFEQIKCIGCNMCVRNCPANAIKISKIADKVFSCELSLANCIFCSQCVFSCPKKALHTTDNFELAQIDKSKLTVHLEELNPEAKMTPEALAQIEAAAAKAKEAALAAAKARQAQAAAAQAQSKAQAQAQTQAKAPEAESGTSATEKSSQKAAENDVKKGTAAADNAAKQKTARENETAVSGEIKKA